MKCVCHGTLIVLLFHQLLVLKMKKSEGRRYFNHSIEQLESIFEQSQFSEDDLSALKQELSQRKDGIKSRAGRLRIRVVDALAILSAN